MVQNVSPKMLSSLSEGFTHSDGSNSDHDSLSAMSESYRAKVNELCESFPAWRKVKGDGNCYYRAVIFAVLETCVCLYWNTKEHISKKLLCTNDHQNNSSGDSCSSNTGNNTNDNDRLMVQYEGIIEHCQEYVASLRHDIAQIRKDMLTEAETSNCVDHGTTTGSVSRVEYITETDEIAFNEKLDHLFSNLVNGIDADYVSSSSSSSAEPQQMDTHSIHCLLSSYFNDICFDMVCIKLCRWKVAKYIRELCLRESVVDNAQETGNSADTNKEPVVDPSGASSDISVTQIIEANFDMSVDDFVQVQ